MKDTLLAAALLLAVAVIAAVAFLLGMDYQRERHEAAKLEAVR